MVQNSGLKGFSEPNHWNALPTFCSIRVNAKEVIQMSGSVVLEQEDIKLIEKKSIHTQINSVHVNSVNVIA